MRIGRNIGTGKRITGNSDTVIDGEPGLPYEAPSIVENGSGLANRFARGNRRTMTEIGGVSISSLVERFGTPLYLFSEQQLRDNYRELHRAFKTRYPQVQPCWSYKTNYLDAVCRIFHQEGAWAEVVSEMEYEMARRLGVPGDQIIYNGPYKPPESLRRAFAEGARVQLDSFDELYLAEQIAGELNRPVAVSIRVNMDTGIYPRWDRFGFNLDSGEALQAAKRIGHGTRLQLDGLHCHLGTYILEPRAYGKAVNKVVALARQIREETGMRIRHFNLGGGFASTSTLHEQYAPGSDCAPAFDDYAAVIADALREATEQEQAADELPTLYLETGRALVDDAGSMISRVVGNKRLADGTRSMIIDAGLNVLFTSLWYRHQITPVVDRGGLPEETVVYGPLCMNIDVVRPQVLLPPLAVGDAVVISPVGAYNVTQSMQFIRLRPGVVLIGCDGEVDLIRRPETVDVVKAPELLPKRLQAGRELAALPAAMPATTRTDLRLVTETGAWEQPEEVATGCSERMAAGW